MSGFMLEHGLRQRRVRLLWSPLRVTEFGEGVTTAGGEWVCSQSASVSRQLSKVHQGCGAARPCGLTGVVWPRAWRAGDCGPPQNFGPSPGPEEIAAVHLAIGRAASEVRGRKASIRGVRQVACRSTAARPSPCMTSFCGCGGSSTMCARGGGWLVLRRAGVPECGQVGRPAPTSTTSDAPACPGRLREMRNGWHHLGLQAPRAIFGVGMGVSAVGVPVWWRVGCIRVK